MGIHGTNIMLMSRERAVRVKHRFLDSLTFQGLGIAVTSLLLPIVLAIVWQSVVWKGDWDGGESSIWYSAFSSFGAAVTALLLHRRVTAFPGTRGFAYIIPAYAMTFGVVVAVLLALRLSYSGLMLATGFLGSIAFSFIANHVAQSSARRHFYLVPFGHTGIVHDTPGIDWVVLREPVLPLGDSDGAIVADLRHDHDPEWERMLAQAAISGRPVYHTKQLRESLTGRVQIEHLSENSFGSLLPNMAFRKIKRLIDIGCSLLVLPLLLVPLVLVAVAIRLDTPGPIFFRQKRMGYRGRHFEVLKFRTMRHRPAGEAGDARGQAMTRDDDDRITRVGRFLRRTRIDELPQFLNVLRGHMSVIGPRPEAIPLSEWYESELPFYAYRHIVRPGITGWAQVNQGHVAELEDARLKLHYDFYYIKHFSAWLDALIALRTIGIVFSG